MNRKLLARARRIAIQIGFAGTLIALAGAWGIDRTTGEDVLIISSYDQGTVELNQILYEEGDAVAEIYGSPLSRPVRVILPDSDRLIRPVEDSSITLLQVDKSKGENPLQVQTVWFFARYVAYGFLALAFAGLLIPRRLAAAQPNLT